MKNVIIFLSGLLTGVIVGSVTSKEIVIPFFEKESELVKVKKSLAGLCHPQDSQFFDYIIHYEPYDSLNQCVLDGGRLPQRVRENVVNFHSDPTSDTDILIQ